ncbi:uncharacterized protein RSE6_10901 [Rhynchosporium secalis]|uniref:non-specific serine/threonine protein kinase n=1 Tax=Rhynchosporium secalis TaxID=38038 RepID=A0A1E1MLM3_RHYSE|nr:uncharacterized protein RSE6_10901 [Rhynchosporium secalis]
MVDDVSDVTEIIAGAQDDHKKENAFLEESKCAPKTTRSREDDGDAVREDLSKEDADGWGPEEREEGNDHDEDGGLPLYGHMFSDNVEKIEYYRPDGFHPVKIGDMFNQYKVVHKLGYGGFATVWLARDTKEERYVALKIVLGQASQNVADIDIKGLSHVRDCVARGMLAPYIDLPLDHFWFDGPNGRHMCVVSHFHGPSISSFELFPHKLRLGPGHSQRLALQLTQSLAFLHCSDVGIAHGDVTTSNILLELENMDSWSIEKLYKELGEPTKEPVYSYKGGPLGTSAPEHVYERADLTRLAKYATGNLKIVDFGESFFLSDAPEGLGTPARFCSPELMPEKNCGKASDVWALACTIFEMRSGLHLFDAFLGSDGEALGSILDLIGPAPAHLKALGCLEETEASKKALKLKDYAESISTAEIDPESGKVVGTSKISEAEAELLFDLLSSALKYDVGERATAAQLLGHPWFSFVSTKNDILLDMRNGQPIVW